MKTICQAVDQNNTFVFQKPSPERVQRVIKSPAEFSQLSDSVSSRIFESILEDKNNFGINSCFRVTVGFIAEVIQQLWQ